MQYQRDNVICLIVINGHYLIEYINYIHSALHIIVLKQQFVCSYCPLIIVTKIISTTFFYAPTDSPWTQIVMLNINYIIYNLLQDTIFKLFINSIIIFNTFKNVLN